MDSKEDIIKYIKEIKTKEALLNTIEDEIEKLTKKSNDLRSDINILNTKVEKFSKIPSYSDDMTSIKYNNGYIFVEVLTQGTQGTEKTVSIKFKDYNDIQIVKCENIFLFDDIVCYTVLKKEIPIYEEYYDEYFYNKDKDKDEDENKDKDKDKDEKPEIYYIGNSVFYESKKNIPKYLWNNWDIDEDHYNVYNIVFMSVSFNKIYRIYAEYKTRSSIPIKVLYASLFGKPKMIIKTCKTIEFNKIEKKYNKKYFTGEKELNVVNLSYTYTYKFNIVGIMKDHISLYNYLNLFLFDLCSKMNIPEHVMFYINRFLVIGDKPNTRLFIYKGFEYNIDESNIIIKDDILYILCPTYAKQIDIQKEYFVQKQKKINTTNK
jgi:hypothetical protein